MMYDLQIFIEENWQYGARVNINDEIIYALWDSPLELFEEIKEIINSLEIKNNNQQITKLLNLFSVYQCH